MPKREVHIHIHGGSVNDAGQWEENKHPRGAHGKFGHATGGSKQENLSERQAMLREMGSPRYAGRTSGPAKKFDPEADYPSIKEIGEGNYKMLQQALSSGKNKASALSNLLFHSKSDKSEGTQRMRSYVKAYAEHKGIKISEVAS